MTNYHLTPPPTVPSLAVQEAKAKRRQVLAKAAQTRRANYERFSKKTEVASTQGTCYNGRDMTDTQPIVTLQSNQPLIGIPFEENGKEVTRYFSEEEQADKAVSDDVTQTALDLAGAWSDLDWDDMEQALDRIRHESKPTPPIDLDL